MAKSTENFGVKRSTRPAYFSSIEGKVPFEIKSVDEQDDADALYMAGDILSFKQDYEKALTFLDKGYRQAVRDKKFLTGIFCLIEMAWIRFQLGGDDASTKYNRLFADAQSMIQSHIHEPGVNEARARYLHYKGLIHYRTGNYAEGLKLFKNARTFCRPDGIEAAKILDSLGIYYERTGDFQRAVHCLQDALTYKKPLDIPHEEAVTLQILGKIYLAHEEYAQAQSALENSLKLTEVLQDQKRLLSLKNELIKTYLFQGDAAKADKLIQQVLKDDEYKQFATQHGMTQLYSCYVLFGKGSFEEAFTALKREVLPLFKKQKYKKGYGMGCRLLACLHFQNGNTPDAIESMSEALATFKDENKVDELAKTHFELGKMYWEMGKKAQALSSMMEALKLSEQNGLTFLTSYIEDEIYRIDGKKWEEIVQKRANYERIFEKDHTLLEALSALSEDSDKSSKVSEGTNSLISLLRVGQAMAGQQDLDKLLYLIKDETERALNADRCTVFLYDKERNELWSKVASGLKGSEEIRFPAHLGLAGYVAKTGEVLNIKNAYEDPRFNKDVDKKTGYKTENLLCMPMKNRKMEIIGVFQVLNKQNGHFKKADEDLLMSIGSSAGVAIENAQLVRQQKTAFESFIKTLSSTIDARDPITAGHSERVADYSVLFGDKMHLLDDELEALKYASLLHDIGKIGIKEEILVKDGRLTEKEYRHIQKHAYYTYEILKNIHFEAHLRSVPEIAASHHEKMDGTGYFRGLSGTTIPLSGRILALSDVFDAVTSRRHYRNRMPFDKVLSIFKRDAGSHFDPDCVEAFLSIRLQDLSRVLLRERLNELPDMGENLIKELDDEVTVREYDTILTKEKMSKGEADVHRVFSSLYHHNQISYLD
jgi:HD-GYP domain-containing protein (c-di-GMP phosphodiesterase class II)/tetratricopeptide (TPR) repeat protein